MSQCPRCSTPWPDQTTQCTVCETDEQLEHALSRAEDHERTNAAGRPQGLARPAETPRFEPGKILAERYRVVGILGRGGMGEVYRVDDLDLGEAAALKFLPAGIERHKQRLAMLFAEARIARTISHIHICRVHDIGIHRGEPEGDLPFVSMEFVDGEDLAGLLRRIGRLPRDKALEVSRELCAGLAAVHAGGLLHRDIKPSNIMLDGRGHVRLTDFGLAIVDTETRGGLAGTPAYMAPEQLALQETTVRSDIYALGLVLYELFTGRRAFKAGSAREYAWRHLKEEPVAPSTLVRDLYPEIEKVILACLEKIPERRISSAQAVGEILARLESGESEYHSIEQGEVLRALLVCDLVGSTALVETLGNRRAAELGIRHDRAARDLLMRHGGREIDKTDGFLLLFKRPSQALGFGLDYHEALAALSAEEGYQIEARVGIHFGEIWLRENPPEDVHRGAKLIEVDGLGKAVAARLMSLAQGGQTLLSSSAFDLARQSARDAEGAGDLRWLDHGTWRLHGVSDPVNICEVGREGQAPLAIPTESEKVRRLLVQPRVEGWRPAPGLSVPSRNHWRIEKRLGGGGFGEAWLARHHKTREPRCFKFCFDAERLRALQREITLFRLLKEELGERSDINRILDWNLDESPYFIESEYTQAGDLRQWAEGEGGLGRVPLETRLEIVAQVAEALAAAHSVGVLHKDIKPSNILIQQDPEGSIQAQLADFGVGQATEKERLAAAGITVLGLTRFSQSDTTPSRSGTPLYMAPELLEGRAPTQQADLYALGVLLYQVVTGDLERALAQGWKRNVEDELLARDIARLVDGSPAHRPSSAREVAQCLLTLEKRREEERAAREALQNLEAAQRRRTIYKTVALAASIALVVVSTLAIWALNSSREERRARETTEKILEFVISSFEIADPWKAQRIGERHGETVTAREILERGASRIETEFMAEPLVQARMKSAFGSIYLSLGLHSQARSLLEQALAVQQLRLGAEAPETIRTKTLLANLHHLLGEFAEAKRIREQILFIQTRVLGPEHPETLRMMANLANSFQDLGSYHEAERLRKRVVGIQTRVLGADHLDTLASKGNLANSYGSMGKYGEAKRLHKQILAIRKRVLGEEHPDTLMSMTNVATCYSAEGEHEKAHQLRRRTLEGQLRVLGAEHPATLLTMSNFAVGHYRRCEYGEAKRLIEKSLAIKRRMLGPKHPSTLAEQTNLAALLDFAGDYREAKLLREQTLELQISVLGEEHPQVLKTQAGLAASHSLLGKFAKAQRLGEMVLESQNRVQGFEHPDTLVTMGNHAWTLLRSGAYTEAGLLASQSLEANKRTLGELHELTLRSHALEGMIRGRQGELSEAEMVQREVLKAAKKNLGEKHWLLSVSLRSLGEILLLGGDWDLARQELDHALNFHEQNLPSSHPDTQEVKILLAGALWELGEIQQAKDLAQAAWDALEPKLDPEHELAVQAAQRLLEIALHEKDLRGARMWKEELRWLVDTPESQIVSAKNRAVRQDVLEIMRRSES